MPSQLTQSDEFMATETYLVEDEYICCSDMEYNHTSMTVDNVRVNNVRVNNIGYLQLFDTSERIDIKNKSKTMFFFECFKKKFRLYLKQYMKMNETLIGFIEMVESPNTSVHQLYDSVKHSRYKQEIVDIFINNGILSHNIMPYNRLRYVDSLIDFVESAHSFGFYLVYFNTVTVNIHEIDPQMIKAIMDEVSEDVLPKYRTNPRHPCLNNIVSIIVENVIKREIIEGFTERSLTSYAMNYSTSPIESPSITDICIDHLEGFHL